MAIEARDLQVIGETQVELQGEQYQNSLSDMLVRLEGVSIFTDVYVLDILKKNGVMFGDVLENGESHLNVEEGAYEGMFDERDMDNLFAWSRSTPFHSVMTMLATDVLAEEVMFAEKSQYKVIGEEKFTPDQRKEVNLTGLLHDVFKRKEAIVFDSLSIEEFAQNHGLQLGVQETVDAYYDEMLNRQRELELTEWQESTHFWSIPEKISRLKKTNDPPVPENGNIEHSTLQEKVFWVADACITDTEVQTIRERQDTSEFHSDIIRRKRNVGKSESRKKILGDTLYNRQRVLGDIYIPFFVNAFGRERLMREVFRIVNIGVTVPAIKYTVGENGESIAVDEGSYLNASNLFPFVSDEQVFFTWLRYRVSEKISKGELPELPFYEESLAA